MAPNPAVTKTTTIAAGASQSAPIDCNDGIPIGVIMPAQWSPEAPLSVIISVDGGVTYSDLLKKDGSNYFGVVVVPGAMMLFDTHLPISCWIKLVSGTLRGPVNQTAARAFKVVLEG